ncbi:hypothetical protein N8938_01480 [Candidatus Pelagibacter sp.]|nr:hypothetical protein [Candidatus Pelagibacter sp.]
MDKVSSIFATEIKIEVAKNFWIEAKSASFFCHPSYLIEMGYKFKYFGAYKGEELLCVWPLLIEQDENLSIPNYSYFFGPFFKHDSADLPSYKSYSNNLQLINCLIKCVISESNNLSFSLLPEFQDIRPFSWWNYHKPDLPKFQIEVRYTARLDLSKIISDDDFQNQFRPDDKRKKIKKLRKEKPFISKINHFKDHNVLVKLYEDTLARSGASTTLEDSKILKKLISLSQTKSSDINCWVIEAYEKNSETLAGFQLLLGSKKSMYAIAQCAKSDYQKLNINTFLTFESLLFSKSKGYKYFDFNGANSPNRADEKHSYGAVPKSYFQITYKN